MDRSLPKGTVNRLEDALTLVSKGNDGNAETLQYVDGGQQGHPWLFI